MLVTGRTARLFAWWYLTIGIGFLLLALQRYLVGGNKSLIALRCIIGVGFLVLGWLQFRSLRGSTPGGGPGT